MYLLPKNSIFSLSLVLNYFNLVLRLFFLFKINSLQGSIWRINENSGRKYENSGRKYENSGRKYEEKRKKIYLKFHILL
jgi:hypothetical protein